MESGQRKTHMTGVGQRGGEWTEKDTYERRRTERWREDGKRHI